MSERKRLLYLSQRRGMRELDLILGPFAEANLSTMTEADLTAYQQLLEYPEVVLYDWLVRRQPMNENEPTEVQQVMSKILSFQSYRP